MEQIDRYINSLCKNMDKNSNDVCELKLEMKSHILRNVEKLIVEGKTESDSIKISIGRFGDISEVELELLEASNIKKRKLKSILYVSIIFSLISIIFLVHEFTHANMIKINIIILFIPMYIVFKYIQLDKYRLKGININKFYESMKVCFVVYSIFIISDSIFPLLTYPDFKYKSLFDINLIPFQTISNMVSNSGVTLTYLIMDLLKEATYLIPLGFLYPVVFRKDMKIINSIRLGLTIFITIVVFQIIFRFSGISAKNILISFDYMILNIIGVLIGVLINIKSKKIIY